MYVCLCRFCDTTLSLFATCYSKTLTFAQSAVRLTVNRGFRQSARRGENLNADVWTQSLGFFAFPSRYLDVFGITAVCIQSVIHVSSRTRIYMYIDTHARIHASVRTHLDAQSHMSVCTHVYISAHLLEGAPSVLCWQPVWTLLPMYMYMFCCLYTCKYTGPIFTHSCSYNHLHRVCTLAPCRYAHTHVSSHLPAG